MPPTCCTPGCAQDECIQLTDREMLVCETVCGSERPIAFSAIRRSAGLHQEILSRILRRLQKHRVIEKVEDGYRRVVNN